MRLGKRILGLILTAALVFGCVDIGAAYTGAASGQDVALAEEDGSGSAGTEAEAGGTGDSGDAGTVASPTRGGVSRA